MDKEKYICQGDPSSIIHSSLDFHCMSPNQPKHGDGKVIMKCLHLQGQFCMAGTKHRQQHHPECKVERV